MALIIIIMRIIGITETKDMKIVQLLVIRIVIIIHSVMDVDNMDITKLAARKQGAVEIKEITLVDEEEVLKTA